MQRTFTSNNEINPSISSQKPLITQANPTASPWRPQCQFGPKDFSPSIHIDSIDAKGFIAYSDWDNEGLTIFNPDTNVSIPIHKLLTYGIGGNDHLPKWSPDGKRIAFIYNSSLTGSLLMIADLDRGEICPFTTQFDFSLNDDQTMSWSPDGKQIALRQNQGWGKNELLLFTLSTGSMDIIATDIESDISWIDSSHLAYIRANPSEKKWEIVQRSVDDNRIETILSENRPIWDFGYSPDKNWLAYSNGDINIINLITGTKKVITRENEDLEYGYLSWSPNNKYLLLSGEEQQIFLYDNSQIDIKPVSLPHGMFTNDSWSPDSNKVVVAVYPVGVPGQTYILIFDISLQSHYIIKPKDGHSLYDPSWNIY